MFVATVRMTVDTFVRRHKLKLVGDLDFTELLQ